MAFHVMVLFLPSSNRFECRKESDFGKHSNITFNPHTIMNLSRIYDVKPYCVSFISLCGIANGVKEVNSFVEIDDAYCFKIFRPAGTI